MTGVVANLPRQGRACDGDAALNVAMAPEILRAAMHYDPNAQRDGLVECHSELRTIAVSLFAVANNLRWLGSGPRCGFYEVMLPDLQPGSSIMPGKINPVMSESLMQVTARVMGNDQTIAVAGVTGAEILSLLAQPS